jgi:D-glucosaminate-6-phosphate ammonia-lyase
LEREDLMKSLSVLPYLANTAKKSAANPPTGEQNIYQSIGVEPIINCRGTFTIIGGSVERPEVHAAMQEAGGYFVQYDELAEAVGKKLAEITGAEWGIIPAGCAAGIKHVTAACVSGGNPERLIRIPDLTGMDKTQVIIPRYSRNAYDHAVRSVGVEIIMVETPQELRQAINPRTAMIYISEGQGSAKGQPLSLEVIAEISKPHKIPILSDAAAENLTLPPIHLERGATVVAYSGGKALCGPQCAGLVLGDKDILMSAWQASAPHHGPGRDNKIGKEEIMGMLAAVETWITRDHAAEWKTWISWLDNIAGRVAKITSATTQIEEPSGRSNHVPILTISWNPLVLNISGEEVAEDFARNKPRIAVGGGSEEGNTFIRISPHQMQPGNDKVVADRIHHILSQKHSPKSTQLKAAEVDISGHWDLKVHFFSSTSQHRLFIQQEGNWLEGSHQSDFSSQEMLGMVEGNQVKFQSNAQRPGDSVSFLFSGKVSGDTISGSVFLGEYLSAKFTANRSSYAKLRKPITIPGGPPQAT